MNSRFQPFIQSFKRNKRYYFGSFLVMSSFVTFEMIFHQRKLRGMQIHSLKSQMATQKQIFEQNIQQFLNPPKTAFKQSLKHNIKQLIRLMIIFYNFLPYLLMVPVVKIIPLQFLINIQTDILVRSIEKSGSLFVKGAQYLSHRSDLLDEKMIAKIQHLREKAPTHSFQETLKILINNDIYDQIEEIQENPIASGIIGQVYKAKLKGYNQDIIIKVRHPNVMQRLREDLSLVFNITDTMSRLWGFGWMKIPLTKNELLKVIIEQADFRIEGNNLRTFQKNFEGLQDLIKFPDIYYESEDLLIENFIDNALNLYDFGQNNEILRKKLAGMGLNSFFKMFIYDNFIHADCHAGKSWENPRIKSLYLEFIDTKIQQSKEQFSEYDLINDYQLYLVFFLFQIDFGMVSQLKQNDYKNMLKFLKAACLRDSSMCVKYVTKMAQNYDQSNKELMKNLEGFSEDIQSAFSQIENSQNENMNLGEMAQSTLQNAQKRGLLYDGNVSVFLGNTVILEGLARSLDPNITMLQYALPYLMSKKVQQIIKD